MIVIWQGYGFIALLAGVIPVLVHFVMVYPNLQSTALPVGLSCLVSAGVCLGAWRFVRRFPGPHTLYWLPLWFWAIAYVALAGWCLASAAGWR